MDSKKDSLLELNSAIKEVTNTDEFKHIIGNISDKLLQLNDKSTDDDIQSDISEDISIDENSLDTVLTSYLMNKNGENISDCLTNINKNLEKLCNIINKK